MKQSKWIAGITILATGFTAVAASDPGYDRITGRAHASRSEVIAPHAMAATSQPLATQVALDIMKSGGSAVDAAIAANAMLGLMEPTGSGIGGDLFAIVWDAENKELVGLNASGRAPKAMTLEYFQQRGIDTIPPYGPLPVSVPGAVDGWFQLRYCLRENRFSSLRSYRVLPASKQETHWQLSGLCRDLYAKWRRP
jgi:gamma-glutamyltranspeptidase/glutathione hydrolase